jgi:ribosomal protein RSM22 (predicted rRNA methylase)
MTAWSCPADLEDALWAAAAARLPAGALDGRSLAAAIAARTVRYTSERGRLHAPMAAADRVRDLAARALFFTVADAAKIGVPLAELAGRGLLPGAATLRVLDVGAGCGAMTLGLVTWLAASAWPGRLEVELVDRDALALAIAADAIAAVAAAVAVTCRVSTRTADVTTDRAPGQVDLVLAGTVINEVDDGAALVRALVATLAPTGVAIVIEPALRTTTRALHALRDELIAGGTAAILAPCTRRAAPCPALAHDDDWCHEHRPAQLPPRTQQLATTTGLRDGDAKWSFLALCHPAAAPPPLAAWRVVAEPHAQKGKIELTLCGADGWVSARLLRRHRAPANRAFERAHRGDLLTIAPPPVGGALELGPDHQVGDAP